MRRFAGIGLGRDRIPDETMILNVRHLPKRHWLTSALFAGVNAHLSDKGITLRPDTLIDVSQADAIGPGEPAQDHRFAVLDQGPGGGATRKCR